MPGYNTILSQSIKHLCVRYSHSGRNKVLSKDVRETFIKFMKDKGHTFFPSSSVLPQNDSSLLFVNAGMNQFKPIFLGLLPSDNPLSTLKRVTNSQKCIRAGGKHNDLQDVGKDVYHHTFFEMLGNWSFGDYSKCINSQQSVHSAFPYLLAMFFCFHSMFGITENILLCLFLHSVTGILSLKTACELAWQLLTDVYQLPKGSLYVTYFGGDAALGLEPDFECYHVWRQIGVPEDHIFPFGVKDNFWEMGNTGPCGPCTEIHFDHFARHQGVPPAGQRINSGTPSLIELWNLVFIQYNRQPDGSLETLQNFHVDTGMGLERLVAVLQATMSNYDTDLFQPLFQKLHEVSSVRPYQGLVGSSDVGFIDTSYRLVSDHARMFTVAISDGVFPDEYDAGNTLRRVIRRALTAAKVRLKAPKGAVAFLVPCVVESLGDFFPELLKNAQMVIETVNEEEDRLLNQIAKGQRLLDRKRLNVKGNTLSGEVAWECYFVHGLQQDLIEDLALSYGLQVDWGVFYKKMKAEQKSEAVDEKPQGYIPPVSPQLVDMLNQRGIHPTDDVEKYQYYSHNNEYEFLPVKTELLAIVKDNTLVSETPSESTCQLVVRKTNFYHEAGGQMCDQGRILGKNFSFKVKNVFALKGYIFHEGEVEFGCSQEGAVVQMEIDKNHRLGCMRHHTVTHLLNVALKRLLPKTVQKSSYVGPSYLRFEYNAKNVFQVEEVQNIEDFLTDIIRSDLKVNRSTMPLSIALQDDSLNTLQGEMYPDPVSVITIVDKEGHVVSKEACCGTHVLSTGDIGEVVLVSHQSIAQTRKRVHIVAGQEAKKILEKGDNMLSSTKSLSATINCMKLSKNNDFFELKNLMKRVKELKTCLMETVVPWTYKQIMTKDLETMDRQIMALLRFYNKHVLTGKIKEELTVHKDNRYAIAFLKTPGDDKQIIKLAGKELSVIPHMIFFHSAEDKKIVCHCYVPQNRASSTFNAKLWIKAVEELLEATVRSLGDADHICTVKGDKFQHLHKAVSAAHKFIESDYLVNR
ncbi:alanine--tRNA ligase, cytoplasmic-like isoform X2 [Tachypleus tridentatus]|uniref:alanine--tRNA ligase, cytoplasmic-like isoform X2 n=1 Tax=Tachypleus tridentatus TaxID=6853 RepID=UPI003FD06B31